MNDTCYNCKYYDEMLTEDNDELQLCQCKNDNERPKDCPNRKALEENNN